MFQCFSLSSISCYIRIVETGKKTGFSTGRDEKMSEEGKEWIPLWMVLSFLICVLVVVVLLSVSLLLYLTNRQRTRALALGTERSAKHVQPLTIGIGTSTGIGTRQDVLNGNAQYSQYSQYAQSTQSTQSAHPSVTSYTLNYPSVSTNTHPLNCTNSLFYSPCAPKRQHNHKRFGTTRDAATESTRSARSSNNEFSFPLKNLFPFNQSILFFLTFAFSFFRLFPY